MKALSRLIAVPLLAVALAALGGCDMLGIDSPEKIAAAKDADGKAIGGACRHAGRAIEDCFALNRKADRAAVFAGWREMNDYMRENKIEAIAPQLTPQGGPVSSAKAETADGEADKPADSKPAAKGKTGKTHDS